MNSNTIWSFALQLPSYTGLTKVKVVLSLEYIMDLQYVTLVFHLRGVRLFNNSFLAQLKYWSICFSEVRFQLFLSWPTQAVDTCHNFPAVTAECLAVTLRKSNSTTKQVLPVNRRRPNSYKAALKAHRQTFRQKKKAFLKDFLKVKVI